MKFQQNSGDGLQRNRQRGYLVSLLRYNFANSKGERAPSLNFNLGVDINNEVSTKFWRWPAKKQTEGIFG
ncbi:hypothetical protein J6590_075795 [Homalodisca vitripennis]|nr:hypothetical protein J6590_075795 [Homalodisca vitripennis]